MPPPPQANARLVFAAAATVTTAAAFLYYSHSKKHKTDTDPSVFGSLVDAASSVGKAAVEVSEVATNYLQKATNSEALDIDTLSSKRLQDYMKKELENQMIEWKRKQPVSKQHQFELFLLDNYPENVKTEGNEVVWVDPRVQGDNWRGAFQRLNAEHAVHQLGPPPM
jgi:hypothetical protein